MKKLFLLSAFLFMIFLSACGAPATVLTSTTSAKEPSASKVVTTYLRIFNASMKSGDFSALDSVYVHDATFTQSNPKGTTTVVHGLTAITKFDQTIRKNFPGFQWTVDSMHILAPSVVLVYQHTSGPSSKVPGRCIHVFVVDDGKITRYDWVTFYPGK